MIRTFFGAELLDTPLALVCSLLIGILFGLILERAGFGSSRRIAGVFYFRDMTVVKVMFSALITSVLGFALAGAAGLVNAQDIYFLPTVYGAQLIGGGLFGLGLVMAGWCPGTAAVGLGSGRVDALFYIIGALGGSIAFNETYKYVRPYYDFGQKGVSFVFEVMQVKPATFIATLALAAVVIFWICEIIEHKKNVEKNYSIWKFLPVYSLILLLAGASMYYLVKPAFYWATSGAGQPRQGILEQIAQGKDHIEPEELAERLSSGESGITLVDLRTPQEYEAFHLRGAINVQLTKLNESLAKYRNKGILVLYSNGMVHPAQAWDYLKLHGYSNVYVLSGGLAEFMQRCLMPVSLRPGPFDAKLAEKVNGWRLYFKPKFFAPAMPKQDEGAAINLLTLPGVIETSWLSTHLSKGGIRVYDMRSQPEYNSGHLPGALCVSAESLRGMVNGISSKLLPFNMLAEHFSLMGLTPREVVVIQPGERMLEATYVAMALERVGHLRYGILNGDYKTWKAAGLPTDTLLPEVTPSQFTATAKSDDFTVNRQDVLSAIGDGKTVIIDVRPEDYFLGRKSEEPRAGHLPGAVNRPFTLDVTKGPDGAITFKPIDELAAAYAKLIPSKDTQVIVHCRTGLQASQTWFVLKRLLGYRNVKWYDAGFSEWSARPELPVVKEDNPLNN